MKAKDLTGKIRKLGEDLQAFANHNMERAFSRQLVLVCMGMIKARRMYGHLIDTNADLMDAMEDLDLITMTATRKIYQEINRDAGKFKISPFKVRYGAMREANEKLAN